MTQYAASVPVKTKMVEIKVLYIDSKQASLAMVRQLPFQSIIDKETGDLLGLEWGIIRYTWKNCCQGYAGSTYPHDHVLWESKGKLYVCSIQDCYVEGASKELRAKVNAHIAYLSKLDQVFIGI